MCGKPIFARMSFPGPHMCMGKWDGGSLDRINEEEEGVEINQTEETPLLL